MNIKKEFSRLFREQLAPSAILPALQQLVEELTVLVEGDVCPNEIKISATAFREHVKYVIFQAEMASTAGGPVKQTKAPDIPDDVTSTCETKKQQLEEIKAEAEKDISGLSSNRSPLLHISLRLQDRLMQLEMLKLELPAEYCPNESKVLMDLQSSLQVAIQQVNAQLKKAIEEWTSVEEDEEGVKWSEA